ncbi:MAG: amino acid adenylation domain-containing protein [Oleiphilus sp.]
MNQLASTIKSVAVDFDPFAETFPALVKSIPSTPAQQEMWASILMDAKASCAFNESFTLDFQGELNIAALNAALQALVARHDALRACFSQDGLNLNIYEKLDTPVTVEQLAGRAKEDIIAEETQYSFDLVNGPLFKVRLLKAADDCHYFIFTAHHIVCDGWSLGIVIADLSALYNAFCSGAGNSEELEEAFSFIDYAEQCSNDEDKTYWLDKFSQHIPDYELILDKERPKKRSFNAKRLDVDVDLELIHRIKKQAASLGFSLSAYSMAIYFIALNKWTGESSLVVGMPTAGQPGIAPYTLLGHCVTTVPIVSQVEESQSIADFIKQTSNEILDAFEHQNFTFGELIRELPIARDPSRIPLLPILFNFDAGVEDKHLNFQGLQTRFSSNPRFYENFEQFMNVADYGDHFTIECQYNTDLFVEDAIRARIDEYVWLLTQASLDANQAISTLELSPINEYADLLSRAIGQTASWHTETPDAPYSIAHYISHQAKVFADKPALKFEDTCLSYQQLDTLSAQWAHLLAEQGVSLGDRVGLCLDRSEQMLAALLGILKLGATYIPLDPDFPDDRLAYMIEDSGLQHLISQSEHLTRLPKVAHRFNLDELKARLAEQASDYPVITIPPDTPAYIIYTSGSTGKPKGVVVPQSSVMNFLHSMAATPGLTEHDTLMAVTTLSFDIAVLELYLPLWVGACVVIAKKQESSDGRRLLELLQQHQATCMQATPATWRLLISAGWQGEPRLKALCGGEALPSDLAADLLSRCESLWNMYGPTETTVWSSCAHITQTDTPPGLGEPIANTQLYVLDEQQRPVPNGIAGELYIGGEGLSLGYNNRDELTQQVFIANPYGSGQLYRTGDKVRFTHDGKLLYMGRLDQQVKVRGYRIELGEIETLMRQHPAIDDCALAVREVRAGDTRLIAYVIWQDQPQSLADIRQHLRQQLPPYMIPQHLESLSELPRTLNNKLDRKALQSRPFQDDHEQAISDTVAASSATELSLLAIWQSVMGTKINSIRDNFFDLGGHSLLIAQIIHRVEADLSVHLKFSDLYEFSSIESLARKIDASQRSEDSMIPARPENEPSLLTLAQQRLWYLNQLEGSNTAFNLPSAFRLKGRLNKTALDQSVTDLVNRQSILRSEIVELNGVPQQTRHAPQNLSIEAISLNHISDQQEQLTAIQQHLLALQNQALDLHSSPLFSVKLILLNEAESILFFMPHHIIFDGWSFDIFIHELCTRYNYHCGDQSAELPELAFQYADYAHWSRQAESDKAIEADVQYWVDHLQGAPNLDMPLDFARPEFQEVAGDEVSFSIPAPLLSKLSALALEQESTLFMVMMASYCALLAAYTDQDDLVIATPMADRTKAGTEDLIGFFVNALVLRFQIHKNMPFDELLTLVKKRCLEGFDHKDAPFEKIVERLNPERDMSRAPVYQTSITYQDVSKRELSMGNGPDRLDIEQYEIPSHDSPLDLNIWFKKRHDQLSGAIVYSTSLFHRHTIETFRDHFIRLLESITVNIRCPLSDLQLTDSAPNSAAPICVGTQHNWQAAQPDAPYSIAHYISHQAKVFADKPALKFEDTCLSYQQLDALSAQWAHLLAEQGVSLGDRVGLCLDRSEQMLAALLGILKLGATYVPLDPDFPDDRLAYMIEDSGLQHLISQSEHLTRLPKVAHRFNLDELKARLAEQASDYPVITIPPDTPAYIIYTSGSTGKPKGVVVPQSSVMNFLHSMAATPGLTEHDTLMAVTTLSFDIAVLELYLPLWVGACVVITKKQESSDGRRLLELLQQHQATCMQATPATWRLLISAGWQGEPRLKALCGGEALPSDLAADLLSRCESLWNMYGPTETTVWSSCARITQTDTPPGLGEPIANTQLYVLDEQQRPVPNGIAGELYIGGEGLSLGYNNRDELTQQVFIANPYGSGQLYRTGDKVRFTHDGKLLYMGRLDQQVKVRGYRIELGEIETLMRQHPAIDDCALAVREVRAGDTRLIAYVIWQDQPQSLADIRQHLRQQLPPYMIPQHLESLSELPRTLNNKLDRKALQTLALSHSAEVSEQQAPDTEKEIWLAQLWTEIAGCKNVAKYDNFFDIGGHSLLSIQVIQRVMDTFGVELKPRDLLLESLYQLALKLEDNPQANPQSAVLPHESVHLDQVKPFYFGDSASPLYGVIHEPAGGKYRHKAILLCSPTGHEYFRTYRMMQLLAGSLAKLGYYCMRFDYHGMGDSSGEFNQMDLSHWQADLKTACDELRAASACEEVLCIGSRLSAPLALSAQPSCYFSEFIFIDPIMNGQSHIEKLKQVQTSVLSKIWHFTIKRRQTELKEGEILGYDYSELLLNDINALSTQHLLATTNTPVKLLWSEKESVSDVLDGTDKVSSVVVEDEGNWYFYKDIDRSISTHKINQYIIESLS